MSDLYWQIEPVVRTAAAIVLALVWAWLVLDWTKGL